MLWLFAKLLIILGLEELGTMVAIYSPLGLFISALFGGTPFA